MLEVDGRHRTLASFGSLDVLQAQPQPLWRSAGSL